MDNSLLKIEDLQVVYSTDDSLVFAVNGLDLDLAPGETLGLVGETGAGKTTTALSIMGLLPDRTGFVTRGKITLDGHDILASSEAELRGIRGKLVSMIFQDPMTSLNPTMTVGDQIKEVLQVHNPDADEAQLQARIDELMELVGLPAARKIEYPHQFSGGMKQRIVIAIALACEPKLLLADEPTTALDVTIQAQVLKLMRNLKEKLNTAMLLITHDLGVVAQICDKVAIMYAGEIIESGTIEQIYTGERHHPYTKGLFGAIPNLKEKTRRLHPVEGLMPDPTNLPLGCAFHPRCAQCLEVCRNCAPAAHLVDGHMVKCHLYKEDR